MVSSPFKMHGKLRSHLTGARVIPRLQPRPDGTVPPHPPTRWQPFVEHFVIEVVDKAVARRHRPIWPFGAPLRLQVLHVPHVRATPLPALSRPLPPPLRAPRRGDLSPDDPRGSQDRLRLRTALRQLVLNELPPPLGPPNRHAFQMLPQC